LEQLRQELQAEIQALRADFKISLGQTKAELVRWVFLTMLGNVALSVGADVILKTFAR
jgi:hypothetical protein